MISAARSALALVVVICATLACSQAAEEGGPEWNYKGQRVWASEYPLCKTTGLTNQSPIDIVTSKVLRRPELALDFLNYDQDVEFCVKNTHHSVSLTPITAAGALPTVMPNWKTGENRFELQEIHFHWGDGLNKGSEHKINGQRAAAEMHLVHYRKDVTKEQLGNVANSALVIGVFIESDQVEHQKLERLVRTTAAVNGTDAEFTSPNLENLINLLPEDHQHFYTYNGSLTTPPCYEVVEWVVMTEPVYVSQAELLELSNFEATLPRVGRTRIGSNYREVLPLGKRRVFGSFSADEYTIDLVPQDVSSQSSYWTRLQGLHMSVRRAINAINAARKDLTSGGGPRVSSGFDVSWPAVELEWHQSATPQAYRAPIVSRPRPPSAPISGPASGALATRVDEIRARVDEQRARVSNALQRGGSFVT